MSTGVLVVSNGGGSSVGWTATKTAFWLTLSPTSGTLAAGANATITLTATPLGLDPGTYFDTVTITGGTNPVTASIVYVVGTEVVVVDEPPPPIIPGDGGGPIAPPTAKPIDNILLAFCDALTYPSAPLEAIVRGDDDYEPWQRSVDPATAPVWSLPWLAALVGIEWRGNATEELRSLIIDRPRYKRGTNAYIRAAAQSTLLGTKSVFLSPRLSGNPWLLSVTTLPSETPDPAATDRSVRAAIPAWVRLITGQEDTPIIDSANATLTIDNVGATVTINNVTAVDVA